MALRNRVHVTLATTLSAALLAACGGASGSDESSGAKTLTLWHYEGANSAMGVAWAQAIEEFEATHPGVTVEFEEKGFEQIRQTAGMALNSSEGPDILEYAKGNATAGLLSKQGLLTDLSEVAAERGWDDKLSPSLQTTARYAPDGTMGSGKWYGIPNYGEYLTVYYNKDLFAKHGVEVPTTFAELEQAMATFVAAGVTPLGIAGAEYPAQQVVYQLALDQADRSWVDAYQLYEGDVDFDGPELTAGTTTFAEWVEKGYVSDASAGLKAEDMGTAFERGENPMMFSGSWWYGRFADEITGFEWGTFLWPEAELTPGSSGNLWVVPQNSDAKDLAYDFIDITMSEPIQNALGNAGGVPVAADPDAITDPQDKELIAGFQTLLDKDALAFYPDWPAPGYYDVLVSGTQKLINGSADPAAVRAEIAKPYEQNLADLGR